MTSARGTSYHQHHGHRPSVRSTTGAVLGIGALLSMACLPAVVAAQGVTQAVANGAESAATEAVQEDSGEESAYDHIWKITELYENDRNSVLQSLVLSGRFQVDFAHVGADQGSHDEWNIRRFRFGAKATMFREITLHTEVEFNPQEADPFYLRLTDANVQWSRSSRLVLTVGKHGVPFTMDGSTSSKELLAIERNNLTTNVWFTQEYAPGVSVAGNTSAWTYRVGVYSGGSRNREFGEFDGSAFLLTRLGYDFAKRLGVEKAELVGAYVYQDPDPQNTFTQPFKHVGSLTLDLEAGAWGLRTDVSGGSGVLGQGDILGVAAMPYYNLTEHAQLVGRYTFVGSPDDNAVVLSRYERFVVDGRGDRYNELYLGFNYFFYGHKLKLQTGVTFADLRDRANDGGAYSGTSGVLGLRTSW